MNPAGWTMDSRLNQSIFRRLSIILRSIRCGRNSGDAGIVNWSPWAVRPAKKLGRRPEKTARQYTEKMKLAITWFDEIWHPCEALSEELGLKWKHLLKKAPVSNSAFSDIVRLKEVVTGELQPVIETRIKYLECKNLNEIKRKWYEYFHGLPKKEASYVLTKVFRGAVKKGNYDHYLQAWQRLNELVDLKTGLRKTPGPSCQAGADCARLGGGDRRMAVSSQ